MKLPRPLRWLLVNSIPPSFLYLHLLTGHAGWAHLAVASIVLTFALACFVGLMSLLTLVAKNAVLDAAMLKVAAMSPSVPMWLDRAYDVALFVALIWLGWGWSAAIWAGQFLMVPFVHSCMKSVRKRADSPQASSLLTAPAGVPLSSN